MSLGVAFQAFFAALFNRDAAARIRDALQATPPTGSLPAAPEAKPAPPAATPADRRSEALTLLSALQREARLLDLVHESLDGFEDAQIGAAAREVLRDTRKTLDRLFAIEPLTEVDEGASLRLESQASPNRIRLLGKSTGESGTVMHRGWKATRCELPKWSGSHSEAWVLAPIEVEVS